MSLAAQIDSLRTFVRRFPPPLDTWTRSLGRAAYRFYSALRRLSVQTLRRRGRAKDRVSELWAASPEERAKVEGVYWMGHPLVARRIHVKSSGRADTDCYSHLKQRLSAEGWRFPVGRALSLGCGHGALERGLAGLGMAERYDGVDLSAGAIQEARRLAAEGNWEQIDYHVGDLEHARFPEGAFDIVYAHQSVHHIEDLDGLCRAVRRALRPGGIFHLNEFVGPDRFQWTDAQLHHLNAFVEALPIRYRQLPGGGLRPTIPRPTIAEMLAVDPSEAIRSSAILEAVGRHFRIVERRDLGGALLHMGLSGIVQNFDAADPADAEHLEAFFALEDRLMAEGVIGSDFVTVTAVRD